MSDSKPVNFNLYLSTENDDSTISSMLSARSFQSLPASIGRKRRFKQLVQFFLHPNKITKPEGVNFSQLPSPSNSRVHTPSPPNNEENCSSDISESCAGSSCRYSELAAVSVHSYDSKGNIIPPESIAWMSDSEIYKMNMKKLEQNSKKGEEQEAQADISPAGDSSPDSTFKGSSSCTSSKNDSSLLQTQGSSSTSSSGCSEKVEEALSCTSSIIHAKVEGGTSTPVETPKKLLSAKVPRKCKKEDGNDDRVIAEEEGNDCGGDDKEEEKDNSPPLKRNVSTADGTEEQDNCDHSRDSKKARYDGVDFLESTGKVYDRRGIQLIPQHERYHYTRGKCSHCGQIGKECFNMFFGPFCLLAVTSHMKQHPNNVPDYHHLSAIYKGAYSNSVKFYCYLLTGEYDEIELMNIDPTQCMVQGTFRKVLSLWRHAKHVENESALVKTGVIRAVKLLGKDGILNMDD